MRIVCFWVCCLVTPACVAATGRLEANRFQHERYPYALFYPAQGRPDTPLGPNYQLENFRSLDGKRRAQQATEGYLVERVYTNEAPHTVERESFYDLLLSRSHPQTAFWLRSVPLTPQEGAEPLPVLAQRYLEHVAALGTVAVPFGVEKMPQVPQKTQLRNVQTTACELSKRSAIRIDFEVLPQEFSPQPQKPSWKAGSVVLVQSGYFARRAYPVLVLAGRSSLAADADALEPDFDQLLTQLVLGDPGQGLAMKGGHTCQRPHEEP